MAVNFHQRRILQTMKSAGGRAIIDDHGHLKTPDGRDHGQCSLALIRLVESGHVCRHDLHRRGGLGLTEKGVR